ASDRPTVCCACCTEVSLRATRSFVTSETLLQPASKLTASTPMSGSPAGKFGVLISPPRLRLDSVVRKRAIHRRGSPRCEASPSVKSAAVTNRCSCSPKEDARHCLQSCGGSMDSAACKTARFLRLLVLSACFLTLLGGCGRPVEEPQAGTYRATLK